MKSTKLLNLLLVFSSLFGFLRWGGGNTMFLFEAEALIFSKVLVNPEEVIHPLIVLPVVGQILLIITVFQKAPNRILTIIGIILLSLLLGLILVIGLIEMDWRIVGSVLPFFMLVFLSVSKNRKGFNR